MIPLRAHAWHTCIHFTIDFVAHDTLGLGLNVCGGLGFLGPGCTCCTIGPYFAQCTAQSTYWAPNTYVLVWMRHIGLMLNKRLRTLMMRIWGWGWWCTYLLHLLLLCTRAYWSVPPVVWDTYEDGGLVGFWSVSHWLLLEMLECVVW